MSVYPICAGCGKRPQVGRLVSHSNRKTKRVLRPNLQKVGQLMLCTKCRRTLLKTPHRPKHASRGREVA